MLIGFFWDKLDGKIIKLGGLAIITKWRPGVYLACTCVYNGSSCIHASWEPVLIESHFKDEFTAYRNAHSSSLWRSEYLSAIIWRYSVRLWVSKRLKIDSSLKNLTWMSFVFFIVLQFKLNLNCNKKICGMLVILERSRILNHRASSKSVGTLLAFLMHYKYNKINNTTLYLGISNFLIFKINTYTKEKIYKQYWKNQP